VEADAALLSFTTDILTTPEAITTCLATYAPVGASRWSGSERWLNPLAALVGRRYATSFVGFHHPWRLFEHRLADFHLHTRALGIVYTASGHRS
jgi:hypothetical protein